MGIMHRDVKPHNVMIDHQMRKVLHCVVLNAFICSFVRTHGPTLAERSVSNVFITHISYNS